MSWILSKALSRFNQKLISCKAVPDAGSRSNFVTYTKEMQRKKQNMFEINPLNIFLGLEQQQRRHYKM